MSINRQMDKDAMVHVYNGISLSIKRDELESTELRGRNLEATVQSEVQ